MVDAKEAWSEVGARFGGLGEKLKEHFSSPSRAAGDTTETEAPEREATGPEDGSAESGGGGDVGAADALKDALRNLADALNTTVEAIGAAAKDPAIAEEVRGVGQAFVNALSTTFTDAGEEVRKAFNRSRPSEAGGAAEGDTAVVDREADEGGPAGTGEDEPTT